MFALAACHHPRPGTLVPIPQPTGERESAGTTPQPVDTGSVTAKRAGSEGGLPPEMGVTLVRPPDDWFLSIRDAYFELDRHDLRADARQALTADAELLKQILKQIQSWDPAIQIIVEGHCDERGSAEYNLALGAMRADAAKDFLQSLGVPAATLGTISYGKERPQCTMQTEECWQKNRRAHLAPGNGKVNSKP